MDDTNERAWGIMEIIKDGKVKIFEFELSNYALDASNSDMKLASFRDAETRLVSTDAMEDMINYFLRDKVLVDINVVPATVRTHNNGRNNTVKLIYTVVYKDIKGGI